MGDYDLDGSILFETYNRTHSLINNEDVKFVDRFGFYQENETEEIVKLKDVEVERTKKWLKMLKNWDKYFPSQKLTKRIYKGIPEHVRGEAWSKLLNISKDQFTYRDLINVARKDKGSQEAKQIDLDVNRTFRNNVMFSQRYGPKQQSLFHVLVAYALYNKDIGYCQGMNQIAALLLMYLNEEEAFWALSQLMSDKRHSMQGFYAPGFPKLHRYEAHLEKVMKHFLPKLKRHIDKLGIPPGLYCIKWFLQCFIDRTPFHLTLRLWDIFMLEGDKILIAMSYTILKLFRRDLMRMDMERFLKFLNSDVTEKGIFDSIGDDKVIAMLRENILQLHRAKLLYPSKSELSSTAGSPWTKKKTTPSTDRKLNLPPILQTNPKIKETSRDSEKPNGVLNYTPEMFSANVSLKDLEGEEDGKEGEAIKKSREFALGDDWVVIGDEIRHVERAEEAFHVNRFEESDGIHEKNHLNLKNPPNLDPRTFKARPRIQSETSCDVDRTSNSVLVIDRGRFSMPRMVDKVEPTDDIDGLFHKSLPDPQASNRTRSATPKLGYAPHNQINYYPTASGVSGRTADRLLVCCTPPCKRNNVHGLVEPLPSSQLVYEPERILVQQPSLDPMSPHKMARYRLFSSRSCKGFVKPNEESFLEFQSQNHRPRAAFNSDKRGFYSPNKSILASPSPDYPSGPESIQKSFFHQNDSEQMPIDKFAMTPTHTTTSNRRHRRRIDTDPSHHHQFNLVQGGRFPKVVPTEQIPRKFFTPVFYDHIKNESRSHHESNKHLFDRKHYSASPSHLPHRVSPLSTIKSPKLMSKQTIELSSEIPEISEILQIAVGETYGDIRYSPRFPHANDVSFNYTPYLVRYHESPLAPANS